MTYYTVHYTFFFFFFFSYCRLTLYNSLFFSSVHRSKRIDFGPHDWHSLPVSGAQTWLVVPGLEPGTEYQFSVLAQNKLGTGPFSEVVTVTTAGRCCKFKVASSMFAASCLQNQPAEVSARCLLLIQNIQEYWRIYCPLVLSRLRGEEGALTFIVSV